MKFLNFALKYVGKIFRDSVKRFFLKLGLHIKNIEYYTSHLKKNIDVNHPAYPEFCIAHQRIIHIREPAITLDFVDVLERPIHI